MASRFTIKVSDTDENKYTVTDRDTTLTYDVPKTVTTLIFITRNDYIPLGISDGKLTDLPKNEEYEEYVRKHNDRLDASEWGHQLIQKVSDSSDTLIYSIILAPYFDEKQVNKCLKSMFKSTTSVSIRNIKYAFSGLVKYITLDIIIGDVTINIMCYKTYVYAGYISALNDMQLISITILIYIKILHVDTNGLLHCYVDYTGIFKTSLIKLNIPIYSSYNVSQMSTSGSVTIKLNQDNYNKAKTYIQTLSTAKTSYILAKRQYLAYKQSLLH